MDHLISENFAIYNDDCINVMSGMPNASIGMSIYSPPFAGLYQYSSDDRDLSNAADIDEFFRHYDFVIKELERITMPGRITCVHCSDIPRGNSGVDTYFDLTGEFIRAYEKHGWKYTGRRVIWNEPLRVRLRTMQKNLSHRGITEDSAASGVASADYLITFRAPGENKVPVAHPVGLTTYAGEKVMPAENQSFKGFEGDQKKNKFSHWIWRQYASSVWDDIRTHRILPFQDSKEHDDEKHVHPLQLDVIERCITLFSNPGETVFTPFMGVGSEVYAALMNGRRGIGVELKPSYYRQALKNVQMAARGHKDVEENTELDLSLT
jgi:DNA modification methylase